MMVMSVIFSSSSWHAPRNIQSAGGSLVGCGGTDCEGGCADGPAQCCFPMLNFEKKYRDWM